MAAICGLCCAGEWILALANRTIGVKIVVYPACKGLGLTELGQLGADLADVAECLSGGMWNKKAEEMRRDKNVVVIGEDVGLLWPTSSTTEAADSIILRRRR